MPPALRSSVKPLAFKPVGEAADGAPFEPGELGLSPQLPEEGDDLRLQFAAKVCELARMSVISRS